MKKTIAIALVGVLLTSACAQQPDMVAAAPMPTATYSGMNCRTLVAEQTRILNDVNELTAAQQKKANGDAVAMGVGMILFWPALFFLSAGSDSAPQLATAKGQYDAIETVMIQRGC